MWDRGGVGVRKSLGQILVEGAFIKSEELERAQDLARRSGKKLSEVLVEQRLVAPETLATVLSFQYNAPIIDLKQFTIQPQAVALVPEELARQHNVLPLAVEGDVLTVAMEDPGDLEVIDTLSTLTRKRIRPVIPLHGGIRSTIDSQYKLTSRIEEQVREAVRVTEARAPAEPLIAPEAIAQAPVVRAVDLILTQAVKDRASDIHIEPQEEGLKVRYRIDGILHDAVTLPAGVHAALVSRIKVLANMNIAEKRRPQDGQFSATIANKQIDFRVATAETSHGEMVVMRVLDKSVAVLQISEVGLSPAVLEIYKRSLASPYGMILISGPTGSGKTTTLYASLGELNPREHNIMTIEDPIEYHFKGINQIQVNREAGITFAVGLRAIMRLDPDIILVGEIRDAETANVAVQAALTGHLVLTSIHANDSISALMRLINLGVEPFLASSAVIASLSQRLVRKVCPYCRMLGPVPPAEAMAYQQEMQEVKGEFYYGRGCNFCSQTGYLGRTGVFELLIMSDDLRQMVAKQAPAGDIKTQALKEGLITLRRDGMLKVRDGITTPREVIRSVFTIG
jgi:general secretion pathway protein E